MNIITTCEQLDILNEHLKLLIHPDDDNKFPLGLREKRGCVWFWEFENRHITTILNCVLKNRLKQELMGGSAIWAKRDGFEESFLSAGINSISPIRE